MSSTHNVYTFHYESAEPNAVNRDPGNTHLLERHRNVSIFWYEFVIFRQQVIGTGGVARPALVWLENNGASKGNVLVQALFRLATCL